MNVSVVIPTHKRPDLLRLSIPALVNQVTDGICFDIHFVQDGADEASTDLLDEAVRKYPDLISHYEVPHSGGPSAPRNHGIRQATGKILILLDDDIVPDPNFVQQHWQFHEDHPDERTVAVGELYISSEAKRDPMSLFCDFPYHELQKHKPLSYLYFWSGNLSLHREFMLENGMFLDDGSLPLLEDMECGYRLAQHHMNLRFHPEARGRHALSMKADAVQSKGYQTGQAQYSLTIKIPDVMVKERFGILSSDLPWATLLKRLGKRAAFRALDNRLTAAVLRVLGAEARNRSHITDFYYYLSFRRNMLAGYYAMRRQYRTAAGSSPIPLKNEAGA